MAKYYIEFVNQEGKDRETIIRAQTPQEAINRLYNTQKVDCYLDIVDITDDENRVSVLDEVV